MLRTRTIERQKILPSWGTNWRVEGLLLSRGRERPTRPPAPTARFWRRVLLGVDC
jgi:hypothetical protein